MGEGHHDPYAMSQAHARGLRRDLFRMIGDKTEKRVVAFERSWDVLRLPFRSVREANAVFKRTRSALRACSYGWHARDEQSCDGLIFLPGSRIHDDGHPEPVLEIRNANLSIARGIPSGEVRTLGTISHHAVERMFLRLNTTDKDDVMQDIIGFGIWIRLMQMLSVMAPGTRLRIEQLPVPTPRGMFLCVRETDTWDVHMRTWVPHGFSAKYDASVTAIVEWFHGITGNKGIGPETLIETFDVMAARPENDWWLKPHRDAVRCPYG